jgi:hypothetical protein
MKKATNTKYYDNVCLIYLKNMFSYELSWKVLSFNPFDLYAGFQFWTKYWVNIGTSTYTWIDLYASIYGSYRLKRIIHEKGLLIND